jgi:2-dehydropantoate 2-reductase
MSNIYIIGSGAIGKVLAVSLKLDNKNVILLRGSVDDQSTSVEKIQISLDDQTALEAMIEVSTLSNFSVLDGIVVLTNKSFGNANLAKALKGKTNNSPVVILQNGLGVEQVFMDNNFPEIYRCVLFVTSQVMSGNKVRFKPLSICPIGRLKGEEANLDRVVDQLTSPGFRFKAELNIQPVIWKKAIINSVFNSICPLLDIDNGIFHREEEALKMAKRVIEECVVIANEAGVFLNAAEVTEGLLHISKASDGQLISTLQDIKNKRETEIETLNFEIVRIAKRMDMGNLVMETGLLGELTKLKSDISRSIAGERQ